MQKVQSIIKWLGILSIGCFLVCLAVPILGTKIIDLKPLFQLITGDINASKSINTANVIWAALGSITTASSGMYIIWMALDKHIWKWGRSPKGLMDTPKLYGRWEGKIFYKNEHEGSDGHPFVLEIAQTFTKVSCKTFSTHTESRGDIALTLREATPNFRLIYYWNGEVSAGKQQANVPPCGIFDGTTILDYSIQNDVPHLSGKYYTNRTPNQTMGSIDVSLKSRKRQNSLKPLSTTVDVNAPELTD